MRISLPVTLMVLLLAIPATALELTPSRDLYGPEDDIEVVAFNETTKHIAFGSSAPFVARNLDTGEVVSFIGLAVMLDLPPGERMSFGILGGELEPGRWALEFSYWEEQSQRCCETVEFSIAANQGAPAEELPVSNLKARYRGD